MGGPEGFIKSVFLHRIVENKSNRLFLKAGTTMMEWDSRMHNNHCVKVLKAAIPFFDVEVGESINFEGLFRAIRPFAPERERRMVDLFLQFFQMRRMMEMMQLFQTMQEMQGESREDPDGGNGAAAGGTGTPGGMPSPDMMSMIKAMIPPEQQGMMDTVSAMMTMMQAAEEGSPSGEEGSLSAEEASPPAEESPENDPPEGAGGGGQDGTVDL